MSTLVEISHKESDDLARKHKEAEIKASIIASLPELPYYQAVYGHGYKSEGSVKLLENVKVMSLLPHYLISLNLFA